MSPVGLPSVSMMAVDACVPKAGRTDRPEEALRPPVCTRERLLTATASSHESMAVPERQRSIPAGQVPFRVRVGVTGPRELEDGVPLAASIPRHVAWVLAELSRDQQMRVAVVSQLAKGVDREFVRAVKAVWGDDASLEVVLPMDRATYEREQRFEGSCLTEFRALLRTAGDVDEPARGDVPAPDHYGDAYAAAARRLIDRSDILIAVWDGGPSGGRGGTADTLLHAASGLNPDQRAKPCVWITCAGHVIATNFSRRTAEGFYEHVRERAAGDDDGCSPPPPPRRDLRRNCCSATSMPAAVQRRRMSPSRQRFTLRWV